MKRSSIFGTSTITVMVQGHTPKRITELMEFSRPLGAEAFGMQFCQLYREYQNEKTYKTLFEAAGLPVYVTNYRSGTNLMLLKDDEAIAKDLLQIAKCGASLCDVMGDLFDKQEDELARDRSAIDKQMKLIDEIHECGSKVLISSHVCKFTPAERVLEMAEEMQRRGADIAKIVVGASNADEEIENLRIINMLKENLKIPFLFLSEGECAILRRIGSTLGNCMTLCVYEHDGLSTPEQPLLTDAVLLRKLFKK